MNRVHVNMAAEVSSTKVVVKLDRLRIVVMNCVLFRTSLCLDSAISVARGHVPAYPVCHGYDRR